MRQDVYHFCQAKMKMSCFYHCDAPFEFFITEVLLVGPCTPIAVSMESINFMPYLHLKTTHSHNLYWFGQVYIVLLPAYMPNIGMINTFQRAGASIK